MTEISESIINLLLLIAHPGLTRKPS